MTTYQLLANSYKRDKGEAWSLKAIVLCNGELTWDEDNKLELSAKQKAALETVLNCHGIYTQSETNGKQWASPVCFTVIGSYVVISQNGGLDV